MQQKIRHRIMFRPVTDPSSRFLFFLINLMIGKCQVLQVFCPDHREKLSLPGSSAHDCCS